MLNPDITRAIDAEWARLGSPGTWWTAAERVEIAHQARLARAGQPASSGLISERAIDATRKIATHAHSINEDWVRSCHANGLDPLPMVELTAIVAKLIAIDTTLMGVGAEERQLPEPAPGEPSRREVDGAEINRGWLPTKGVAGAPTCFSAVQQEYNAWDDLHGQLYLSMDEMRDNSIVKDLHRAQIELLAARTSNYNDCFY